MYKKINIQKELPKIRSFVKEQGDYAYKNWNKIGKLIFHDGIDFSTIYDERLELKFYKFLQKNYPGTGFIGEERPDLFNENADYVWLIDPIDGTKYFGKQVPLFSITLALAYKGKVLIGIVYSPVVNHMYWAIRGEGAYLNGKKIKIKERTDLENTIINAELDIGDDIFSKRWIGKKLELLRLNIGRLRVFAQTSQALCWIARGAIDGYVDLFGMKDHDKYVDIAAGLLICKEAGAEIVEFEARKGENKLIVASKGITKRLLDLLKIQQFKEWK